jgi:hypothetical protein
LASYHKRRGFIAATPIALPRGVGACQPLTRT